MSMLYEKLVEVCGLKVVDIGVEESFDTFVDVDDKVDVIIDAFGLKVEVETVVVVVVVVVVVAVVVVVVVVVGVVFVNLLLGGAVGFGVVVVVVVGGGGGGGGFVGNLDFLK